MSQDWVIVGFILQHLSMPTPLRNHPHLLQHAVLTRLSTYEFIYALICLFGHRMFSGQSVLRHISICLPPPLLPVRLLS